MVYKIDNQPIIVVIRTAGERTFAACKFLVLKQVPEHCLYIVNERPFEAALRRCYRIGMESGAQWMITLDADVLLREDAIKGLLSEAASMPENHFQIEGMILDKLTHRFRWAGYRCYRVKHLKAALSLIPPDRAEIRPEFTTLETMAARGYPYQSSRKIYGVHDFEQYYRDTYRKAFVHANKHHAWLLEMTSVWKRLSIDDADFRIALRGACEGLVATESPRIDKRDYLEHAERAMADLGLTEKGDLSSGRFGFSEIEALISGAQNSPDVAQPQPCNSRIQQLVARYRELGPWRIGPYLVGVLLCMMGNEIKKIARQENKTHVL